MIKSLFEKRYGPADIVIFFGAVVNLLVISAILAFYFLH